MTLDYAAVEMDILNHLSTGMSPVPIIDTEAGDDMVDPVGDGDFTPYIGIIWGGPIANAGDRGIIGVRHDLMTAYFTVRVCAPDPQVCRFLHAKAFDVMTGFVPYNSGEVSPRAGMAYSNGNSQVRPTRYYREHSYVYRTNTIDEVSL